ncbi:hypothetical protein FNV43_RR21858 [Rhamnella rubrinervis]|uniref:non-specific serine/threonine protein kinase n=1 Tax=Rhamnella rubrinervis TaxID=2594499 RepID=A0A8K0GML4_9ROSA|nr:hypothetical protein FNV43_RR21858 [Rhamnella rubrinervis]
MASLSSLVHELRERIAASSSTPPTNVDDDALETRFRAVLPNLLHAYVVPSPSAKEREVVAVLKLLSHTVRNFPGVFYHGKASAILPVLGRILPFFAEPVFSSRHGVIFETVGTLLSLLRTGARDAYHLFSLTPYLLYVASLSADNASSSVSTGLTLRCFCKSFNGIFSDPAHLGDLPASNKPLDGTGILINLTGKMRWQTFATWVIKLLGKCLTEGTLYVEGLVDVSFIMAACSLLCYGDAELHMVGMSESSGLYPSYAIIRNMVYDSSLGSCLNALHSGCPDDVVKLTAADLVNVFPQSIRRTESQELKRWRAMNHSSVIVKQVENFRVGEKRPIHDVDVLKIKRQKVDEDIMASDASIQISRDQSFIHNLSTDVVMDTTDIGAMACKIIRTETDFEVMDLGLHDEMEEVRHEAVLSMPVVAFWSDLLCYLKYSKGWSFGRENEKVKNVVPFSLGYLSCLYGSCHAGDKAALGIETGLLVEKMIPVVLPKLVVSQQVDNQAVDTLYELIKYSKMIWRLKLARAPEMIKEVSRVLIGGEDLSCFLRNHFVHLLNSIDREMLHSEDSSLQEQALKRIEMLIKMMGSQLSTYVPKLMVLLMHAIDKKSLQREGLSLLLFFIEQLAEVSQSSNKYWISQVFAALIPFLERDNENCTTHLDKVVKILEELVLKNKIILKQDICEFPPLPSIPALSEVNKVIQEARGSMTLKDQLQDVVDGLNHENLNVRYMVARELSKLLNLRREDVTLTTVGHQLKLKCADCLGALGAVDPAKVKGFSCQRFKIECSDDDLIYELIHKHLARAFRAAPDTVIQDSAALAIQELLKIAGCEASLDENAASSMSESLKDKEFSKLAASEIKTADSSTEMSRRGQRFICWPNLPSIYVIQKVDFLDKKLTAHATGSRASIFTACRGGRRGITDEILSVLNAAVSENSGSAVHGVNGGQCELCIQTVFTLLDNLGQWVDDVEQELALSQSFHSSSSKQLASKPKDHDQNSFDRTNSLYSVNICQAYARSLMYFESDVRAKSGSFNPAAERSGSFVDEDVSYLMKIYSYLDEPDEVLTSCEQALQTSCGQALQEESTSVQRHSDVLDCLLNMYHLQAMVTHAAWRLGKWDLMNDYLSGADEDLLCSSFESNALFDLDVAKILQAMMEDQDSVPEKLSQSKQTLIAPLAAAGMDSYMRAYPIIVKLHLLRDKLDAQVGDCWLQYAKLCRMAGHYETANRAILEVQASGAPKVHMEKAKLLWSIRRCDGAIAALQQSLLNMPVEVIGSSAISSITSLSLVPLNLPPLVCDTQALNENRAKTLLLYSRWIHYTGQKQKEDVISLYTRVRELQPKWEKGYFYMAKYCDEVLADARKRQEENFELDPRTIPSTSATGGSSDLITERWWSRA